MDKKCGAFHALAAQFTPPTGGFVARRSRRSAGVGTVRPMQLTPVIAIHLCAASSAFLIGPWVIWARRGAQQLPRLHRALGYAWVTLMLMTALSAMFIRSDTLPNIAGYTPIHLFVPYTLGGLYLAFRRLFQGDVAGHRKNMLGLYLGACVGAGIFTLLPSRYLGQLVWGQWLGLL